MDKRFLDAIENATRANRILEQAAGGRTLVRQIEEATRAQRMLEEMGGASHLAKQMELLQSPAYLARQSLLHEEFKRMEAARRAMQPVLSIVEQLEAQRMSIIDQAVALGLPQLDQAHIARFSAIEEAARASEAMQAMFHPNTLATHEMARQIAEMVEPHRSLIEATAWADSLEQRMNLIGTEWAMAERLAISGLSFGNLAHLVDVVRFDDPFSQGTGEILAEEFGVVIDEVEDDVDEREVQYDVAGRNPSLVAFPQSSYNSVVVASGFVLEFPTPPIPQPIENGVGALSFEGAHYVAVRNIENHLRAFVVKHLLAAGGSRWEEQRIEGRMRSKWKDRQDVDRAMGRPVFAAIYYADFAELGQVMAQGNNWPLFQPFFETRDGILESLRRLTPIRNSVMHGRPLSQTDVLYFVAEGARIMKAIGLNVLH